MAFLLVGSPAHALDPNRTLQQYHHTRWTLAEGLPSPVSFIVQTPDGYLWLSTGEGLFRFDGVTFERIDQAIDEVANGAPNTLLVTRNGDLWINYVGSGKFAIYRNGNVRLIPSPSFIGQVIEMVETLDGDIWASIGNFGQPLLRYRAGRWSKVQPVKEESSAGLQLTADGSMWASYSNQLLRLRPGATRFERMISEPAINMRLFVDPAGRLWGSGPAGSRALTGPAGRWEGQPAARYYRTDNFRRRGRPLFDREGNLWIARRREGIERLRLPSPRSQTAPAELPTEFRAGDGLSSDATSAIFEDREGNIWVGTSLGLDRFRNANIAFERALNRAAAFGDILMAASDGSIYIGQANAVYRALPGGAPLPILTDATEPEAICEGPDRTVWIVVSDRIVIFQGTKRRSMARPPEAVTGIFDCGLDSSGRFWLTAGRSGIYRLAGERWERRPASGTSFQPTNLVRDHKGDLWVAWGESRMARLDRASNDFFGTEKSPLGGIATLAPATDGILIGGPTALGLLRNGRLSFATAEQIPTLRGANGIVQTLTGETWALSHAGIVRVKTADLNRSFSDRDFVVPSRVFDLLDGLPSRRNSESWRGLVQGGDDRLWATTQAGIVWVDPSKISSNPLAPLVAISSVVAGERRYLDPASLRLPAGSSDVAIGFSALGLGMPERVQVRYRLEGRDPDWTDPGKRRQAFYTNLAPGTYRFRVIAANEDGVWNKQGATLELTISPTFLQSIWFKLILLLAAMAVLALLYALRLRQVTAHLQGRFDIRIAERERIARELHDTLLQGFQGLMLQFKAAANRLPSPEMRKPLDDALERAQGVLIEGRERVRDLRSTEASADLAQSLLAAASRLVDDNGPGVQLTSEGTARPLYPIVSEELERVTEEAIRNAVAHAKATTIHISLTWSRAELRLAIRDDGVGMPETVLTRGERSGHFGLIGMRERLQRLGGKLAVSSREGAGTEIILTLPGRAAFSDHSAGLLERLGRAWRMRRKGSTA